MESAIPALYAELRLSAAQRRNVDRYIADALRAVMRGDYDWAERSGRYDTEELALKAH